MKYLEVEVSTWKKNQRDDSKVSNEILFPDSACRIFCDFIFHFIGDKKMLISMKILLHFLFGNIRVKYGINYKPLRKFSLFSCIVMPFA